MLMHEKLCLIPIFISITVHWNSVGCKKVMEIGPKGLGLPILPDQKKTKKLQSLSFYFAKGAFIIIRYMYILYFC